MEIFGLKTHEPRRTWPEPYAIGSYVTGGLIVVLTQRPDLRAQSRGDLEMMGVREGFE